MRAPGTQPVSNQRSITRTPPSTWRLLGGAHGQNISALCWPRRRYVGMRNALELLLVSLLCQLHLLGGRVSQSFSRPPAHTVYDHVWFPLLASTQCSAEPRQPASRWTAKPLALLKLGFPNHRHACAHTTRRYPHQRPPAHVLQRSGGKLGGRVPLDRHLARCRIKTKEGREPGRGCKWSMARGQQSLHWVPK
jgi:hypothetical protein